MWGAAAAIAAFLLLSTTQICLQDWINCDKPRWFVSVSILAKIFSQYFRSIEAKSLEFWVGKMCRSPEGKNFHVFTQKHAVKSGETAARCLFCAHFALGAAWICFTSLTAFVLTGID